ncbi:MAG: hypothetical protein HY235_13505 [Acidobacteria bacterium]|nr:hypothetical protein [Acidobacteriota bacterium]
MENQANPPAPPFETHAFSLPVRCHYLLHVPPHPHDLLFLALHGYGMNARTMLELALQALGPNQLVASLQAPNQFYLQQSPAGSQIGYNWGTRDHGAASIRLHHEMVRHVRSELENRFQIPAVRTILIGFSQPVGYNYRFAATCPAEIGGVIGICGGVPKDFETGDYTRVSAALVHIARQEDEFFPPSVTADYERKLRTRAADVEFHLLPGSHRFPSKAGQVIEPWLKRVFRAAASVEPQP